MRELMLAVHRVLRAATLKTGINIGFEYKTPPP